MVATVTSKGQVTLPVELRRRFHLETGARVDFVVRDDGRIELVPISGSMKRLKGMLPKPNNYVSLADMERGIRQGGGAMP